MAWYSCCKNIDMEPNIKKDKKKEILPDFSQLQFSFGEKYPDMDIDIESFIMG